MVKKAVLPAVRIFPEAEVILRERYGGKKAVNTMHSILEQIKLVGLVPVIRLNDPEKAVPLAKALAAGGIPAAEVTFRAAGAEKAIANIAEAMPEMLLGAGTVITAEQAEKAAAAGAKYIISPGFDPEIVRWCLEREILIIPGCATAGEVGQALKLGLEAVKFFPAGAAGGLAMLKALSGPYPAVKFIPTGGVNPGNLREYLNFPQVIACGGSWMVPDRLIDAEDWGGITALASQAVFAMLDVKLAHVGINSADEPAAVAAAASYAAVTGQPIQTGEVSHFVGPEVEVMKMIGRGRLGHLAFGVTDVDRAVRYYRSMGAAFDESSRRVNEAGETTFIYFEKEMGGFAVHLVKR